LRSVLSQRLAFAGILTRELTRDIFAEPSHLRIFNRPNGDFIITYHPRHPGLFLATGGSGHGYKFLPVIGDKIVDAIEGTLEAGYRELWKWPQAVEDSGGDGSRFGEKGINLMQELANDEKNSRKVL
jgi:sarcosine oxidase/L-pipecolate oxidase